MATASYSGPQTPPSLEDIAANVAEVRARIETAAQRAGRDAAAVTLVAVSKTVLLERLRGIAQAGIVDLGENRVQEAASKVEALGRGITWHLIGHLQRNKARAAVGLFDLIHFIDGVELAAAVDRYAAACGIRQRVLWQVNVTGEESKSGFTPDALRAAADQLAALPHLQPEGLMTIAAQGADEADTRTAFRRLKALHDELAPAFPGGAWRHLSMGMTDDFELAVEEGATIVRVGRAIFGERPPRVVGA